MAKPREALNFPSSNSIHIDPYLPSTSPSSQPSSQPNKPFVTLTYATSLDSSLSLSPGVQTVLSGPESKAMTHYLRSKHDVILIGCGTAIADDPSLNCRIEGVGGYGGEGLQGQPRPIVLDSRGRWNVTRESKVVKLAGGGKGKAPWIFTMSEVGKERREILEGVGGQFVQLPGKDGMEWAEILKALGERGVQSVMIEGGGHVINTLLSPENASLVDSVIITLAPTWLGKGGVAVIPDERRNEQGSKIAVGRLRDVKWVPLGEDVVLCGRF
ncbi:5-amino-6-uracil reductase-like protein [Periconia macrospinosa]|uniref:2,5-diamino-6-ribosylamino-4(3H)-pyrimidinone 5'-phosphate reductase n=1 Tax=Periconia macrospinosa TaxID=97972 RepID=A0A2V1D0M9_9PLEO|nr:5-amino-6-uracil reductase-like protein [Periconia macrospinosa]